MISLILLISMFIASELATHFGHKATKYLNPECNKTMGAWPSKFRFSLQKSDYIDAKGIKFRNYWIAAIVYLITIFLLLFSSMFIKTCNW